MLLGIKMPLLFLLSGFVGFLLFSSMTVEAVGYESEKEEILKDLYNKNLYPHDHTVINCEHELLDNRSQDGYVYSRKSKDCIKGTYKGQKKSPLFHFKTYEDCMAICVWRCNNGLQPYVTGTESNRYELKRCMNWQECRYMMEVGDFGLGSSCVKNLPSYRNSGYCCYGPSRQCFLKGSVQHEIQPGHQYWIYYEHTKSCIAFNDGPNYKFESQEECELACVSKDVCDSAAGPWVAEGKVTRYNKEENKCKPGDSDDFWYVSFKKAKNESDGICCPGRPQLTSVTQFTTTPKPTTTQETTTELITTTMPTTTKAKETTSLTIKSSTIETTNKEGKTSSTTALTSTKKPSIATLKFSTRSSSSSSTKSEVESFTVTTSDNSTTESRDQTSNEESTQPSKPSPAVEMSSSTEKSTTREVDTSTDQSTQSSTVSSTESTSMPTSESSSELTQSSTISSTKERTLTPVVPPSKPHSSTVVAINSPKEKEKRSSLILIISLVVVAILLVVLALSLLAFFLHRRNKKAQEREDEIALRRNAARIAEFQALQKKKAEMKKNEKVPPRKLRGQIIEGLPPPGPVGWEPDQISARKFKHMGPLKWEQRPPVTMVHALEKDEPPVLNPDQHIEWDDEQNFVVDIGSEVEEVYRNGQRVMPAKRPSAQPPARNTPRRSAENRQLKAIRED